MEFKKWIPFYVENVVGVCFMAAGCEAVISNTNTFQKMFAHFHSRTDLSTLIATISDRTKRHN